MEAVSQLVILAVGASLAYLSAARLAQLQGWSGAPLLVAFVAIFGGISAGVRAIWPFTTDPWAADGSATVVIRLLGAAVVGTLALDLLGRIDLSSLLQQGAARVDAGRQAYSAATQARANAATLDPSEASLASHDSHVNAQEVGVFPAVTGERPSSSSPSPTEVTSSAVPAGYPVQTIRIATPTLPPLAIAAVASAILVVVGSFGTWVTMTRFVSAAGTEGDGMLTAVLGAAALVLILGRFVASQPAALRLISFGAAGALVGAAAVGIYDVSEIVRSPLYGIIGIGWGLVLVVIAAIVGAIVSAMLALQ